MLETGAKCLYSLKDELFDYLTAVAIKNISIYLTARGFNLTSGLANFLYNNARKYHGSLRGLRSIIDRNIIITVSDNIKSIKQEQLLLKNVILEITRRIIKLRCE